MSSRISGMGWITPLGRGVDKVWNRLLHGDESPAQTISRDEGNETYQAFLVPAEAVRNLPPHSRLRRASAISRFAAAAGLDAIAEATSMGLKIDVAKLALIFAVSNGGVIYTKRFYHGIVESGAQSASPLLFPETVFNAPASHLAAILGVEGASYTIVGDGAVGILGIKMASDLLETNAVDYCLVVAAEEADWVLCDAYSKWRLTRSSPPIEVFLDRPHGTILSEGAGAVLLGREGALQVDAINAGGNFAHQRNAGEVVERILWDLRDQNGCIVASANGTFVDLAERDAIKKQMPHSPVYTPKPAIGESVGASALWQVIIAGQALVKGQLPPMAHGSTDAGLRLSETASRSGSSAIVLACGLNQQAAGLRLST
ncbi:MAG TPA: beta-ketoacyl synthase N-terminal-like domain-containing protein [Chthoniobacterales bacterium]|nr:beta-ketoacyl synthase N-terminal-like domain-containing protein [Chthoniobacterales bacterium]